MGYHDRHAGPGIYAPDLEGFVPLKGVIREAAKAVKFQAPEPWTEESYDEASRQYNIERLAAVEKAIVGRKVSFLGRDPEIARTVIPNHALLPESWSFTTDAGEWQVDGRWTVQEGAP